MVALRSWIDDKKEDVRAWEEGSLDQHVLLSQLVGTVSLPLKMKQIKKTRKRYWEKTGCALAVDASMDKDCTSLRNCHFPR